MDFLPDKDDTRTDFDRVKYLVQFVDHMNMKIRSAAASVWETDTDRDEAFILSIRQKVRVLKQATDELHALLQKDIEDLLEFQ